MFTSRPIHMLLMSIFIGFDLPYQLSSRLGWKIINFSLLPYFVTLHQSAIVPPTVPLLCLFSDCLPLLLSITFFNCFQQRKEGIVTLISIIRFNSSPSIMDFLMLSFCPKDSLLQDISDEVHEGNLDLFVNNYTS